MKKAILALAVISALVTAVAATAPAAPKPGFLPGTWIGKGTITGTSTDGPYTTHLDGGIAFTLRVDRSLRVSGGGTWKLNMLGSQDGPSSSAVDSTMQGTAAITFAGTGAAVTFTGNARVIGEMRMGDIKRPVSFAQTLAGRLLVTRAGKCRVVGASQVPGGGTLKWTAVLKGSGTCRA